MSHKFVVIDMSISTFEVMLSALSMRGCIMDEDRVITKTMRGMFVLTESSGSFILKLEPIFIMNKVFMFCKTFVDNNLFDRPFKLRCIPVIEKIKRWVQTS